MKEKIEIENFLEEEGFICEYDNTWEIDTGLNDFIAIVYNEVARKFNVVKFDRFSEKNVSSIHTSSLPKLKSFIGYQNEIDK